MVQDSSTPTQGASDPSIPTPSSTPSSETGSSWIGSTSSALGQRLISLIEAETEAFRREVAGDPSAWLRTRARALLPLFPSGPSEEVLLAETSAFWLSAAERAEQCGRCPTFGGACENSYGAIADGERLVLGATLGTEPCPRFAAYRQRRMVQSIGIPKELLDVQLAPMLATASAGLRDAVTMYVAELKNDGPQWLVITGGSITDRTRLLVAVTRAVIVTHLERSVYEWSFRLYKQMHEHMNEDDAPNPIPRINEAWFFALGLVNRTKWSEWFLGEMDGLLFSRWGKPLAIESGRTIDQLSEDFDLSGQCFASALVVNAAEVGR